jgi:hypothetical protein
MAEVTFNATSVRGILTRVRALDLVNDVWRQQSIWSRTANTLKKRIERARAVALAITVSVAVLGTFAGALADSHPLPARLAAGAAAFGAASLPLLRPAWSGRALRDWTRARSVSEAIKGEVYLWLARVGNCGHDDTGAQLVARCDKVRATAADLLRYQAGVQPEKRELPAVTDLQSYFAIRVGGQIDSYYRRRAGELQHHLRRFRLAEIALALLAALFAAIMSAIAVGSLAAWIGVVTTSSAALAAHVAASRSEYLVIEYLRTADQLQHLTQQAAIAEGSTEALEGLARAAEDVISIQNEGWMAKLAADPSDQHIPQGRDE